MSAGVAALTEVLTPDAYRHLAEIGTRLAEGCRNALAESKIPAHVIDLRAKGGVCYRPDLLHDYRDSLACEPELLAASSPWMMNRRIFQLLADKGQWMLSIQHSAEDIETYVEAFAEYCAELAR
jgi:glutamate-1-semialdehyde 2,1-aminomutase